MQAEIEIYKLRDRIVHLEAEVAFFKESVFETVDLFAAMGFKH